MSAIRQPARLIHEDGSSVSALRDLLLVIGADYAVMIHAYFDESGSHSGSVVTCVAGYLFTTEQLQRFEVEWRDALDRLSIASFHMVDCAHGTGNFKGVPAPDRAELVKRLIGIIKRRAEIGIVASVRPADYKPFVDGGPTGEFGAYILCLIWCVAGVSAWIGKHGLSGKVAYFFESGHQLQRGANEAMYRMANGERFRNLCLYHSHTFIGKDGSKAIQAADLLAWQWHREWDNRFGKKRRTRRLDFMNLLGMSHIGCHLTEDHLLAIANTVFGGKELPEEIRRFPYIE
jgi:hypothetical protein